MPYYATSSSASYTTEEDNSISHNNLGSHNNNDNSNDQNFIGALKEWAIICKALEDGKQTILFRKGGIMEYRNGFELKYKNFLLFPTFEHQDKKSIRLEYQEELQRLENDFELKNKSSSNSNLIDSILVNSFVEIINYGSITNLEKLEPLKKFHIWSDDYVKMRFNYNPKKPLFVLLLRTYKLNNPVKLSNRREWAGCKSWIQIDIHDQNLEKYFMGNSGSSSTTFEYLKSVSKPCIDDDKFNILSKEVKERSGMA